MAIITKENGYTDFTELICEIAELPEGRYRVVPYKERDTRTSQQNRWLWGTIYPTLLPGLKDIGYDFTKNEEVHEFCKSIFNDKYVNKHTGETIDIPDSTKEMDTVTFSTYTQVIREWALEYLYIEIPDPIK